MGVKGFTQVVDFLLFSIIVLVDPLTVFFFIFLFVHQLLAIVLEEIKVFFSGDIERKISKPSSIHLHCTMIF